MPNIIKSLLVLFVILIYVFLIFLLAKKLLFNKKSKIFSKIISVFLILLILVSVIYLAKYTYPFDKKVSLELCEAITVPEGKPSGFAKDWYTIYSIPCFNGSFIVDSEHSVDNLKSFNPKHDFDLENYTYIIVFGAELVSFSVNVWDQYGPPIIDLGLEEKLGKPVFSEGITPNTVYIYRINRMAVTKPKVNYK